MDIRLGLHLDGQYGRDAANQIGAVDVGPLGLLSILETQLGLVPPATGAVQRTVQYRDCLQELSNSGRFFQQSFEADDFGTAATLLSWRDEWRLHGWTGEIAAGSSQRLHDMVDLEKAAAGVLDPGMAERLLAVLDAMGTKRTLIESVTLLDALPNFVPLWQLVLNKLPIQGPIKVTASGRGLLGELQQRILNAGQMATESPLVWDDDGSLVVARGETTILTARWISETMTQSGDHALLVATSEAAATDAYLASANHPRQGLSEASVFRPALQLLPLVLDLLWNPLNFNSLIQFLTHPICPLRSKVRRRLAEIQSQYPGIGGPRWQHEKLAIQEEAGEQAAQIRDAIEFWVEHPRFDPSSGVPTATVLERIQKLAEYFRNCPSDASEARHFAYMVGYNQCMTFCESLGRLLGQEVESLRPRQLEQLAAQATAHGSNNPLRVAEVGAIPCITHPGAVTQPNNVVLWGPLDMPSMPPPWPWSKSEIAALRSAKCAIPDAGLRLQQAAAEWLRPILAAKEKLILVLPPLDHESHPVWQMIKVLIPDLPIYSIESMLRNGSDPLVEIKHTPLPRLKRWWTLPEEVSLPVVAKYSYSQLEKQIFNPYQWLLGYAAKLRSGTLLSLVDDFRLRGLLAHSLVDRLYRGADGLNISDAQFAAWLDPAFDQLIKEEGAVYLMPGRRTDLENLRQSLRRAVTEMRDILRKSGVTLVESERELSGHFAGGALGGYSDLVLTRPDGSNAIIDMKWTGKVHRTKLEESRHLQLAIYAELLRQSTGHWPTVAYFLFKEGKLLTRESYWFSGVPPVGKFNSESTAELWQRFLVTWHWRQEQFEQGLFEVALDSVIEDPSTPPEEGLPPEVLKVDYNEFQHLAGWEERA